jgi:hypothetical protein
LFENVGGKQVQSGSGVEDIHLEIVCVMKLDYLHPVRQHCSVSVLPFQIKVGLSGVQFQAPDFDGQSDCHG